MTNRTSQRSRPTSMTGRALGLQRIAERARRFPAFEMSPDANAAAHLSDQDRALAGAIEHIAARHWLTLEYLLGSHLRQPWERLEPALQAALLGGAGQLIYLDRVPDHAAISETVEWAKTMIRPGAGKLTNAILRRIAEMRSATLEVFDPEARDQLPLPDGRAVQLNGSVFADDPIERIAQQTGHRRWMLERWAKEHGEHAAINIALHSLVHAPITITADGRHTQPPVEILGPHQQSGFLIARTLPEDAPLGGAHAWRVQDPGTARPIELTSDLNPDLIIDYCAGRGTKTHQLLAMHPSSMIIATDINDRRRAGLRAAFDGVDRVQVVEPNQLASHVGRADLLVLDVPCSNSGVLARRVEAKYRLREADLQLLVDAQRQIIADSLTLLAPNGHLLYATCSIDEAENQQQAAWVTQWHRMPVVAECTTLPAGMPGEAAALYHDGGYGALLAGRQQ